MGVLHRGRQSFVFDQHPSILASAAIGGKKEQEGPLASYFDYTSTDTKFRQSTWEKAESKMQQLALDTAKKKIDIKNDDIDMLFAGDLLNQCISSSYSVRDTGVPFFGLYGACSTMAEGLCLAGMSVNAGYSRIAAAMSSSHFATAERQYRFPLGYGGQRTPTAQWTVTGAACALVGTNDSGPFLNAATTGAVMDYAITDANNMGAAMAPAACDTIVTHLKDLDRRPEDYELIVTGDLGRFGTEALFCLCKDHGVDLSGRHLDCGNLIFHPEQKFHCGGSGCGCSAVTLTAFLLDKLERGECHRMLFLATGALLSPTSSFQGESIPGIAHAVVLEREED